MSNFWAKVCGIFCVAVAVALLALLGITIEEAIRSNGQTDYCFIEMYFPPSMAPQFLLTAHRPWRDDRHLGAYTTLDEAKSKADMIGCHLNSK